MFRILSTVKYGFLVFVVGLLTLTAAAQDDATPLISWHPDGSMLALTNLEGVTILDADTLETLNEIPGTVKGMTPIALVKAEWSPDGTQIAIFNNMNIEIWASPWSPTQATLVTTIQINDWPKSIAWNPIGTQIAVALNESVKLADTTTGLVLQHFYGSWSLIQQVLWTSDDRLVQTGLGRYTSILNQHSGEITTSFYTMYDGLITNYSIAFSPDNNRIAIGDSAGFIEIRNDTRTPGKDIQLLPGVDQRFHIPSQGETSGEVPIEITSYVLDLDWSFDGRYLASASDDGTVRVWNPDIGENLTTITVAPGAWVGSAAWRPDSLELAYGNPDGTVTILVPDNVVPAPDASTTPTPTED
jgi:WD40 repeat protein